jgi:hypothetical protein
VYFLACFFVVFDLGEVEGHGFESAGVDPVFAGDFIEA